MSIKKYTIKDLAEGRVAVKNDGTVEELREVLKLTFPNDPTTATAMTKCKYYFSFDFYEIGCFWFDDFTNLPTQSVKDFLK